MYSDLKSCNGGYCMINYTEDLISFYVKNITDGGIISIEDARNVLIDKYNISKIKALGILKIISQSIFCADNSDTYHKICFVKNEDSKGFKFTIDGAEQLYSHLNICIRKI